MGCSAEDPLAGGEANEIEIKIKMLDSRTYTMRVNKQVPVPDLKQQIATVTGVSSEQQRLICRGRVLKDDHILSAYHVEDGHTLHLVTREPVPVYQGSNNPAPIPDLGMSHGQDNQGASEVLHENLNVPNQGDFIIPEINQVFPDSLTILSQFLRQMRDEFGRGWDNNAPPAAIHQTAGRESGPEHRSATVQGLTPPASLAEVVQSTRQLLIEQAGEPLLRLQRQLENHENVTNLSERQRIQSRAWRTGVLLQNLGIFLLELGRAAMALILGQTPAEAGVPTGPALFLSPSGPNPLIVQRLPFQPGTNSGPISMGTGLPGSGLVNGFGLLPMRIYIQIQRGSPMATVNVNQEQRDLTQQSSGPGNRVPSSGGENPVNPRVSEGSSVAAVPMRTVISPFSRISSGSSDSPLDLHYPALGRSQHVGSGHTSDGQGSPASNERQPTGFQAEQYNEVLAQEVSSTPSQRHQAPSESQNFSITDQEDEGQIPSSVLEVLRIIFAGEEIEQARELNSERTATDSVTEHPEATTGSVNAPEVTDEAIFLSNMLRQMMPFISQDAEPNGGSSGSGHGTDSSSQVED